MRGRCSRRCLLVAVVLAGSLAGCGVPQDGTTVLDQRSVPYDLLSPAPTDPASPAVTGTAVTTPRVFLLDGQQRLVGLPLRLDARGVVPVARRLLGRLAAGPTEQQRAHGLASALGPGVDLHLAGLADGVAHVAVSLPAPAPAPDRLPLAIGQVVLTVTSVAGVDRVQFVQDGQLLPVPLPGGAQTTDPVGPADYRPLLADTTSPVPKAAPGPTASIRTPARRGP